MHNPSLVTVLARALLAGEQELAAAVSRVRRAVGKRGLPGIAGRYLAEFKGKTRPRQRDVEGFLLSDRGFRHVRSRFGKEPPILDWLTEQQQMLPVLAAREWKLPAICSIGELCAWLRVTPEDLEWFADLNALNRKSGISPLGHYNYRLVPKRSAGYRLIEAPKQRLKLLQRQILAEILDPIPAHPAAHGFIKGRSIRTFTAPHTAQRVVLRMDLQDFFPSIPAARIQAFFRTAGYPSAVASYLTGICVSRVPIAFWYPHRRTIGVETAFELRGLYAKAHLPQGAPTSPALANLCAYRADCRLYGLAQSAGASYTRYADDLAFSGNDAFSRQVERFSQRVAAVLLEEGFDVQHRKTRIMRQSVRQQLAGLVVNRHANIARDEFDRLKATLTNCARLGPDGQNHEAHPAFRAHLEGRVAFVESIHPGRGARLRAIFDRIPW